MSRSVLWIVVLLTLSVASLVDASPASDLLFRGVKITLSAQDKEDIARQLGLALSKDRKAFVDDRGTPLTVQVRELHLNADRQPEVLVIISGSAAMFGMAGSGVQLYIKKPKARYVDNLGFPAADVKVLPARTKGFRDLMILGPGFDCPVWRWNGSSYQYSHTVKCS